MKKVIITLFLFFISLEADDFSIDTSYYFSEKNLSFKELSNIKEFKKSNGKNFGFKKEFCYLKLEFKNFSNFKLSRYFKFEYPYIDYITLLSKNGVEKYGQLEKFNSNILSLHNVSFLVELKSKESKTIYLQIKSSLPIKTNILTFNREEYFKNILFYKQIYSFVYGVLIVMILYNFIIYLNIKEKAYLYYVLFHFSWLIAIFAFSGLGFEYIWANYPIVNLHSYGIVANFLSLFDYMLIIYFLDLDRILPKIANLFRYFAIFSLLVAISSLFIVINPLYEINTFFTESFIFILLFYMIFYKKSKISKYILIAKVFLFFGVFILTLSEFGLIKDSFFVDNSYLLGIMIELILMSLVLSYNYKDIKMKYHLEERKRKETEKMLIAKHKLSILGEMLNSIVHQWRQPLSEINSIVFKMDTQYSIEGLSESEFDKNLTNIESLTYYLSQTINDFRNFSLENTEIEKFKIETLIDEVISILNYSFKLNKIELKINYSAKNIYTETNRSRLSQILIIILNNAKDALLENEVDNRRIFIDIIENRKILSIKISNSGKKIPKEIENKIFQSHFSTKNRNENSGIGLYIAKEITNRLNISLKLLNNEPLTTFEIKI